MTQLEVVLQLLRERPSGVCLADVPEHIGYTLRNRCAELRKEGFNVQSARCREHWHAGPVYRYRLVQKPEQLELGTGQSRSVRVA